VSTHPLVVFRCFFILLLCCFPDALLSRLKSIVLLLQFPGLKNLENLNLSFTLVTDSGMKKLSGLTSLKSLNLDARQITDAGLAVITSTDFHVVVHSDSRGLALHFLYLLLKLQTVCSSHNIYALYCCRSFEIDTS
jgi:hypothetical protein